MIILVDPDILIDVALDRAPFADAAAELLDALEHGTPRGFVAWHTISNFYYLVAPKQGRTGTLQFVNEIMQFLDVAPTTSVHLRRALDLPLRDFEDAMQVGAATACNADCIATRNVKDFKKSPIPALAPAHVLSRLV